jgi:hypothetical protein
MMAQTAPDTQAAEAENPSCDFVPNGPTERDTIAEEDRASYDEFDKLHMLDGDTYSGYFYDRNYVWLKVTERLMHEHSFLF